MSNLEGESVREAEHQQTRGWTDTKRDGFQNMRPAVKKPCSYIAAIKTRRRKSMPTQNCVFDHLIHKESRLDSNLVTKEESICSKALFRDKHNLSNS